jgi:subtilisin family serine protease
VDIISLSFGYARDQPIIKAAIDEAMRVKKNQLLIFAADGKNGNNESVAFPARYADFVIPVYATTFEGETAHFNPPINNKDCLATLGVDVPSAWSRNPVRVPKSGTSQANPILAGIAANMLHYARNQGISATTSKQTERQSLWGFLVTRPGHEVHNDQHAGFAWAYEGSTILICEASIFSEETWLPGEQV